MVESLNRLMIDKRLTHNCSKQTTAGILELPCLYLIHLSMSCSVGSSYELPRALCIYPPIHPSLPPSFHPSILPPVYPSVLPPSFLPSFPPSSLLSFHPHSFLPSSFLPSSLPSFLPSFIPSFLPCFVAPNLKFISLLLTTSKEGEGAVISG